MKKIIRLTESDLARIVKRVIKENEEDMIRIPRKFSGIRSELGSKASPQDIIDMYNEVVASEGESVPLEKYEDGYFWNEYMDDIMVDVILDELNYGLVGEEEDYDEDQDNEFNMVNETSFMSRIQYNKQIRDAKNQAKENDECMCVVETIVSGVIVKPCDDLTPTEEEHIIFHTKNCGDSFEDDDEM